MQSKYQVMCAREVFTGTERLLDHAIVFSDHFERICPINQLPANQQEPKRAFALPGFIDMHTHSPPAGTEVTTGADYVKNGITRVRDLGSDPRSYLEWDRVALARPMPCQHRAGPLIDERGATAWPGITAEVISDTDAEQIVSRCVQNKWEWIKLYKNLTPGVANSLIAHAKTKGIRLALHVGMPPVL